MPLPGATWNASTEAGPPEDRTPPHEVTVGIHTLGCRLNQYESDGILNRFQKRRYRVVPMSDQPDIAIINTCTVTEQADARNRNIIRSILRKNPAARVFVTGCYAQTDPEALLSIKGVCGVIGNDSKAGLFDFIESYLEGESQSPSQSSGSILPMQGGRRPALLNPFAYGDVFPVDHSRAYLKIQDGCDRQCTYCKVPQARGGGISRSSDEILEHGRRMDQSGIPEIVLTGVNLGWYRDGGRRLPDLIEMLLDRLKHSRLRLSSIEPSDVGERLAQLSLHKRFCNYLHVPLQSGSTPILRRMKRSYTAEAFLRRIEKVRSINPLLFLGTDVMVGFPGETDEDFESTLAVLRAADVAGIHPFPFSPRAGTPAVLMPGRPHGSIVRERMARLIQFREQAEESFYRRMDGRPVDGIVEDTGPDKVGVLTGEYLRLQVDRPSVDVRKGHVLGLRVCARDRRGVILDWSAQDDSVSEHQASTAS